MQTHRAPPKKARISPSIMFFQREQRAHEQAQRA
jgi:hypothetical protein